MTDDDVVAAVVGLDGAVGTPAAPAAPRVHGGFGCLVCGRIVGTINTDGRCSGCGPLPKEPAEPDHMQRHRDWAERFRSDRR